MSHRKPTRPEIILVFGSISHRKPTWPEIILVFGNMSHRKPTRREIILVFGSTKQLRVLLLYITPSNISLVPIPTSNCMEKDNVEKRFLV